MQPWYARCLRTVFILMSKNYSYNAVYCSKEAQPKTQQCFDNKHLASEPLPVILTLKEAGLLIQGQRSYPPVVENNTNNDHK